MLQQRIQCSTLYLHLSTFETIPTHSPTRPKNVRCTLIFLSKLFTPIDQWIVHSPITFNPRV
ncbi:hypothetical protein KAM329D_36940 [Aeromonas caviae]|jgi:hypothetical protein|nr:hypothetical protein KAM341_31050 [Aeromonas caviae]GJC24713.1 hypothetical protein KAM329D_36940 [Aeromonas caviae]